MEGGDAAGYLGGKRFLASRLCKLIDREDHDGYAEPFVGMGGIFLRRSTRPKVEGINDINGEGINFFRVLQEHYPYFIDLLRFLAMVSDEGATLVTGGTGKPDGLDTGYYVKPTIFANVSNSMTIAREEIFGPVLSVIGFSSFDEAMQIANDTIYGLAAAVWTSDLSKAHRAARTLRAGSVWVNQYDGGDMTAPFGGFKQSGNGRDKSLHAFDKYTELKATWIKL